MPCRDKKTTPALRATPPPEGNLVRFYSCHCERSAAIHKTTPRPAGTPLARGEQKKTSAPVARNIALCSLHSALSKKTRPGRVFFKMGCRFARLHVTCADAWFHHRLILHAQNPVTPPIKMGCRHRCRQRKSLRVGPGPPLGHHPLPGNPGSWHQTG